MPDKRLVLLGDGPEMQKLRAKAGPNIEFLGFQGPEVMNYHLSRAKAFIFPSEEDFGIVPLEAQSCGTPVIAYGSGGALETVVGLDTRLARTSAPTGIFFDEQNATSLVRAVLRFEAEAGRFAPRAISEHAARFRPEAFKAGFREQVLHALDERSYAPERPMLESLVSQAAA